MWMLLLAYNVDAGISLEYQQAKEIQMTFLFVYSVLKNALFLTVSSCINLLVLLYIFICVVYKLSDCGVS